jgi:hypothetical protein
MGTVWIRCPSTGRKVSTGLHVAADSLEEFPDQLRNSACPVCGNRHSWTSGDAWAAAVAPERLPQRAVEAPGAAPVLPTLMGPTL